ncbi:TlpA disulfide reductase family protein [Flavobacterium sp. ASV13]|uniref:TlpA family protein disulfide reductase n=1 Tax=Flavobacterium sp. ASV13 TaxID=1506583 RepID=UPI00068E0E4A|nr:TlpA disulfide reductase family protein [Flavobacterium sp. ASV13]
MKHSKHQISLLARQFFAILFSLTISFSAFAQKATIKGIFERVPDGAYISLPNKYFDSKEETHFQIPIESTGNFSVEINISHPQIANLVYYIESIRTIISCDLFVSPGDDFRITIDSSLKAENVKVKGTHQENNQLLNSLSRFDEEKFTGDTLPDRAYKEIKDISLHNKNVLDKYIKTYKPSKEFIKTWQFNLEYFAPQAFYSFEQNNKFSNQKAYVRNLNKWKQCREELFSKIKINNDEAMNAPFYLHFVYDILGRKKEELWHEASGANQAIFFKEWYNASVEEGGKLFFDDMTNILTEKIIQKYYTGRSAEYAYAVFFTESLEAENNKNLPQIFENFKNQFPNSNYINQFEPAINKIIENNKKALNDKMIFVDKGDQLKNFDELISQFKGKTVLIDMWGTWCAPCRQEINKNSQALHDYFKDKDVQFLYVANHDSHNPENWKKLISYESLEGFHILANEALTQDIMTKTKGQGYPTYIVLSKDGSYELSKAGYPMEREVLIKQLESAIAK